MLNTWIAQAEGALGEEAKGGRLGWLVASSVAIAAVQRAIDTDGRRLFLFAAESDDAGRDVFKQVDDKLGGT